MSSVRWPTGGGSWQSQQLSHTEKREMKGKGGGKSHSWWWDSHNAPKNSKWLEDNLNDMDAKVKAMLKLIEEDADSFAKRAEMYYKKRPELVSLVEEFYRAYRSLAERYDQLTGHIRQIPQEIQAQFGFSGDAPPGSPGSGGSVRRRAAGFSVFGKQSKEKGLKHGSDSSSSSSSDSDSDSKKGKPKSSDEMLRLQQDNEQLRNDLDKGTAHHQALEARLAELQEELKSLQQENVQLHRNAASAHSEIAALEAEIERLKRENRTLGEEASSALRTADRLQQELEISQGERHRISIRLEEIGLTVQDLEDKIKELKARILQLSEELLSSNALCEHQKQELDALWEERSVLQQEVSDKACRIVELEEEIARLRGILSVVESERDQNFELHQAFEKELANVHIDFSSLKEEREKLSEKLLLKVQHVESLEQQLIEVRGALEVLKSEKVELVDRLNTTESSLVDMQNEFHRMQGSLNEEITVQVNEKLGFQKQIEECQAALEALHGEKSRGIELQDLFDKRIADLELQLKQAQDSLESSENEKVDLANKAATRLLELQSEFDSVQEGLNQEISVQAQERLVLADQVEGLKSSLEAERSRAAELQDSLEKRVVDLELQLKQSNESLELTEREKVQVIGLRSKVENDILNLQVEFSSVQERLNGEISAKVQEKQILQSRIEELEAALAALEGERDRVLELQAVLEKQLVDYDQELKQVQAALEQANEEKAEVGELLSKTELSLSELQAESRSTQEKMKNEISSLFEEKQFLTAQIEELQATLAALHGEKSRGVELHDVLEKRMIELQQELSQAKQEASSLSVDVAEKAAVVFQLEEVVKTRDDIVSRLEADFIKKQEEGEYLRSQLEDSSKDLLAKQEEVEAFRSQLEDSSKELQSLLNEVQRLQVLLRESEELATSLERKASDFEQECELGRIEATRLKEDLEDKVATVGRLEGEVQDRDIQLTALRRANATLKVELASTLQRAQQLVLDVKTSEGTATRLMEELAKVKVDLDVESSRANSAEEKSSHQEQVIFDLQEEKARFFVRVDELESTIKALQEEVEGCLVKIQDVRHEKEACDVEILALKDELSKVKLLSEEKSSQLSDTISSLRIEISRLEIHVANCTEELQSFEKVQAEWYLEKAALVKEISQVTIEKEELQNTVLMWTSSMEKLETEHATLKSTSREVESSLLFHQNEHSRVQSEVSEKAEKIQWLEEELKRLELELLGSQEAAGKLSKELQNVSQELTERLLAEEEKVRLLHGDVDRLQQELLTAKDTRESLVRTCEDHVQEFKIKEESLEDQILKFKGEIQDLDDQCKELVRELEEKNNEHEVLKAEKQGLEETLLATQLERENAMSRCDSLHHELGQEHECRVTAEAATSKHQAEITELLAEIARLQTELQELKNENKTLNLKLEAALEQERIDAVEIDTLLAALQGWHEDENGSPNVANRSWHFEARHSGEGMPSTLRHLKESMLNLLTDRSRIRQEAAAHAEHIKALHLQIENSGQILEASKGDYCTLLVKYETTLTELQSLHLRIEQFESKVNELEEEKRRLHDQLVASVSNSDQVSSELLREKKELYEKLVIEGEHVLKLQQELKLVREETVENSRHNDNLEKQIEKLNLEIQEITKVKDEQEKSLQLYVEEKAALVQSLNEALESLSSEKAEVIRLQEGSSVKDQMLLNLEEEIAQLKATLSEKEQEFKSSLSFSEQKSVDLLVQLGVLTQEKEDLSAQFEVKVVLVSDKDKEIQRLLEQLHESGLRLEDLKDQFASICDKHDTTRAELENLCSQLSSVQEENGRLGLDVLARTVSVTELTETVSNAEKQNADLSAKLKTVQENDLLLQEQVVNLQLESEELKQTVKAQAEKIHMLDEEIFNLRELHTQLQNDHECISVEKQRSLDEHNLTLMSLEKMKEELLSQQSENARIEKELKAQSARILELETTLLNLEKEKQAFSVEMASTVLLLNDVQSRDDDLQEEINRLRQELTSSNEQLQEKIEKIENLMSVCGALQEEKTALNMELEMKIQAFGSLDASFCALKDEHFSLVDKYELLTEEATSGANLIVKLQEEISQLSTEKEAQAQALIRSKTDIQRLQEDLAVVQDSEKQLRQLFDVKVQEIIQLKEELDRLKAARQEEYKQNIEMLEIELKRLELVVISLRDEKVSLSEHHALTLGRCNDLEAMCKSLQWQLAEQHAERKRVEAQLSLIEELRKEALNDEEMGRIIQERVASKQHEIDQVQSINEDLKEITRNFESEVQSLKDQIIILQKKNTSLNEEVSTKASHVQELKQSFTSLKETKVLFEGGLALAVGNVTLVQAEVDKLLENISKLNEFSIFSAENVQKMEDRIYKLQVSDLNLRDEISGLAKKEKSYVIAVRFMRAEFICLVQRIKAMKEEKVELARLAELAMEAERKKNGEALSSLHQELAFLREENKRQRIIIVDRAEEKREAIRQLCATLDYMQTKNRRLEGVINSVRDKIQRRIAASGSRR